MFLDPKGRARLTRAALSHFSGHLNFFLSTPRQFMREALAYPAHSM
jgi:hypothetical protein